MNSRQAYFQIEQANVNRINNNATYDSQSPSPIRSKQQSNSKLVTVSPLRSSINGKVTPRSLGSGGQEKKMYPNLLQSNSSERQLTTLLSHRQEEDIDSSQRNSVRVRRFQQQSYGVSSEDQGSSTSFQQRIEPKVQVRSNLSKESSFHSESQTRINKGEEQFNPFLTKQDLQVSTPTRVFKFNPNVLQLKNQRQQFSACQSPTRMQFSVQKFNKYLVKTGFLYPKDGLEEEDSRKVDDIQFASQISSRNSLLEQQNSPRTQNLIPKMASSASQKSMRKVRSRERIGSPSDGNKLNQENSERSNKKETLTLNLGENLERRITTFGISLESESKIETPNSARNIHFPHSKFNEWKELSKLKQGESDKSKQESLKLSQSNKIIVSNIQHFKNIFGVVKSPKNQTLNETEQSSKIVIGRSGNEEEEREKVPVQRSYLKVKDQIIDFKNRLKGVNTTLLKQVISDQQEQKRNMKANTPVVIEPKRRKRKPKLNERVLNYRQIIKSMVLLLKRLAFCGISLDEYKQNSQDIFMKAPLQRIGSVIFFSAIRNNSLIGVVSIVKQCRYVVYDFDHKKQTCVHKAAKFGLFRMLQYFLSLKAEPNSKDSNNRTPLFYAIEGKNIQCIKVLLSYNADVSEFEKEEEIQLIQSALMYQSEENQYSEFN